MSIGLRVVWFWGLCLCASVACAQEPDGRSAHEVVQATTEQVMSVVREAESYVDEDPERYYSQIQTILDPVIDFRGFARGVMGPYASSERYRSLDAAGRQKLREQLDRFTEVMRTGLVRTYGKGLLAFGGTRIELPVSAEEDDGDSRASVQQLIYSEQTDPYVVYYQMGRDPQGEWKLRNMIIDSVNLGEIYRNQFESSARAHAGDLDAVISNWGVLEIKHS